MALLVVCSGTATQAQRAATSAARGAGSQSAARKPGGAVSPFRIKNLVDENRRGGSAAPPLNLMPTWRRLGLDAGEGFDSCKGYCEAHVFRHELDGRPAREVVLKLTRSDEFCRYLVFTRAGAGRAWRLLGHVDHNFNRYEWTRHRVLPARGRNWLVVFGQEGSGSGFSLYAETWYEVTRAGVRPVLRYPVAGQVVPWPTGLRREFHGRVVGPRPGAGAVTLSYSMWYGPAGYGQGEEWRFYRNRHRLRYVWDTRRRAFAPDHARSNISEAEVNAVAELRVEPGEGDRIGDSVFFEESKAWSRGGGEVFLKNNLRDLLRAARGRDERLKEWLGQVLRDCADTPEKKILERALRAQGRVRT